MEHDIINQKMTCRDFIALFKDDYPLLKDFKSTPQDPEWHAEGDVEIHTDMVLAQVHELIHTKASHLSDEDKAILVLAALFHDYAKPIATKEMEINDKVRIVAPRHEGLGASLLYNLNIPLGIDTKSWMSVIQLTAYHHIPKLLVIKDKSRPQYARLARQVKSLELLYWLEYADMRGRTCVDEQDQIDILDLFKIQAKEYGLWESDGYGKLTEMVTSHFPNDSKDFHRRVIENAKIHYEDERIFMLEEELAIAYNYTEQPHLILTCGMAGAGKSSWINENASDYYRIELDRIRDDIAKGRANQSKDDEVIRIAHNELRQALREKRNIIWDATNYRSDFRKRIIDLGLAYGAFTEIVAFHKPLGRLIKDNKEREHSIPDNAFNTMLKKFQWPEIGEAHTLRIIYH